MEPRATESGAAEGRPLGGLAIDDVQAPDKAMDHAWRYFALHAQQRMSVFNFFVVLSGVLTTGIVASLQSGKPTSITALLGALLTLFAFVFRQLDRRGSDLVKLAEEALVAGEASCMPPFGRIVGQEQVRTSAGTWTFGRSFRLLFWTMGVVGLGACLFFAICRLAT